MRTQVTIPKRKMNGMEESFSTTYLEPLRLGGEIQWWEFEPVRLRIGVGAFYKPDFIVVDGIGQLVSYETKGHWREAARVRIKVAADRFPWIRFFAVTQDKRGVWNFEEIRIDV